MPRKEGLGIFVGHGDNATIIAHLDALQCFRVGEHAVTFQLGRHVVDHGFDAKWLATANALKGFFFVQN